MMALDDANRERLLAPADVAQLFSVDPKTVSRWATTGKISSVRTLGGHRRFKESEILRLLELATEDVADTTA